jgi:hypothetical protein
LSKVRGAPVRAEGACASLAVFTIGHLRLHRGRTADVAASATVTLIKVAGSLPAGEMW